MMIRTLIFRFQFDSCFHIFVQFLNMLTLADSFQLMAVNQKYRKFSPGTPVRGHAKAWWKYAYNAIVDAYIRPYSWERIKAHR